MKIVDRLRESKIFVDKSSEEGGWLTEGAGGIESDLDWKPNERGGSVQPTARPANAVGDIHTHPFAGAQPTINYRLHRPKGGAKTFSYTETVWQDYGYADAPTRPDQRPLQAARRAARKYPGERVHSARGLNSGRC